MRPVDLGLSFGGALNATRGKPDSLRLYRGADRFHELFSYLLHGGLKADEPRAS